MRNTAQVHTNPSTLCHKAGSWGLLLICAVEVLETRGFPWILQVWNEVPSEQTKEDKGSGNLFHPGLA